VEQGYDITSTQPQLFVARDFDQLFDVLKEVERTLVHHQGGDASLAAALQSGELSTLHFGAERFITGTLGAALGDASGGLLSFEGRVGVGARGSLTQVFETGEHSYHLPFGSLVDNAELRSIGVVGRRVCLRFASGAVLEGELANCSRDAEGRILSARFLDYRLEFERAGMCERGREYSLFVAPELITAHPGATASSYYPLTEPTGASVPKPRQLAKGEQDLLSLYERAVDTFRNRAGSAAVPLFQAIHRELNARFPDEWLLRWNLLECLCKWGETGSFGPELERELLALELKFAQREPIASGLRYLASLAK